MDDHGDHQRGHDNRPREQSFWRSRSGFALIVALAALGLLLVYEHRVHILGSGLLITLLLVACVGVHLLMHGGHGGHGSDGDK